VTGSNTGVGWQTARQLAIGADEAREARVIVMACRTPAKAYAAMERIQAELPENSLATLQFEQLDLTDYESIKRFADEWKKRKQPLHVLVNNAGVNAPPSSLPQPFRCERMFVANYLGPWLLTDLLLPVLEASAPSRIINVTSYMHRLGKLNFKEQMRGEDDLGGCTGVHTYSSTKLAQIFHAHELHRRYAAKGVSVLLAHPGACYSDIWLTLRPAFLRNFNPLLKALFLTTEQGAASSVLAATKRIGDGRSADQRGALSEVEHYGPYRTLPVPGMALLTDAWQPGCCSRVTRSRTSDVTYDVPKAANLWNLSRRLCDEWAAAADEVAPAKQ